MEPADETTIRQAIPSRSMGSSIRSRIAPSGDCFPGYLWWNGYIPANRINSVDANGKPNGIMGVPDNYKPANAPLIPWGQTALPANAPADTDVSDFWDTNTVWMPAEQRDRSTGGVQRQLEPVEEPVRNCSVDVGPGCIRAKVHPFQRASDSSVSAWTFSTCSTTRITNRPAETAFFPCGIRAAMRGRHSWAPDFSGNGNAIHDLAAAHQDVEVLCLHCVKFKSRW